MSATSVRARILGLLVPACLGLAFAGCASPGFPRAPSLHLPAPVNDLSATRVANRVELHWASPANTTDGLDLTYPLAVEVCRDPEGVSTPNEGSASPCTVVLKVAGHAGPSSAIDQLPANLTNGGSARQLLTYRVRVLNASGRAAAPTASALIPAGPPLDPVEAFRAVQQKDGVRLEWSRLSSAALPGSLPSAGPAIVEVLRTDLTPMPASAARTSSTPTSTRKPPAVPMPRGRRADLSAEIRLRPEPGESVENGSVKAAPSGLDGMIDRSALPRGTYSYRARRVVTVSSSGKSVEIFSESTPPVTIAMRDTFPPAPPRGLVSVPGTTGTQASSRPTIDLSWQPNTEADLAGYHVYRTDLSAGGGGIGIRLTASPVGGPAYRDLTVAPGRRYAYHVTAVDQSGNESLPSATVQDSPDGR